MPRYFFHVREGDELEIDDAGQDLPDEEAVRKEAQFYASELLRDASAEPGKSAPSIEVTDARGVLVLRLGCMEDKDGS
jgi:hypothetical protein